MTGNVHDTIAARHKTHGDFTDVALAAQSLKNVCRSRPGWDRLAWMHKEALDMIMHKAARILSGDPTYPDHWHDIAGYAERVLKDMAVTPEKKVPSVGKKEVTPGSYLVLSDLILIEGQNGNLVFGRYVYRDSSIELRFPRADLVNIDGAECIRVDGVDDKGNVFFRGKWFAADPADIKEVK